MFFLPPYANMFSVRNYFKRGPAITTFSHDITLVQKGVLPMAACTLRVHLHLNMLKKLPRKKAPECYYQA
jgi:hypothetical protein